MPDKHMISWCKKGKNVTYCDQMGLKDLTTKQQKRAFDGKCGLVVYFYGLVLAW